MHAGLATLLAMGAAAQLAAAGGPVAIGTGKLPTPADGGGLAVTSAGAMVIAFGRRGEDVRYDLCYRSSADGGATWSAEHVVAAKCFRVGGSAGGTTFRAQVHVDDRDGLWFFYLGADGALHARRAAPAGAGRWAEPTDVPLPDGATGRIESFSAAWVGGRLWIATAARTGPPQSRFSDDRGASWSEPAALPAPPPGTSRGSLTHSLFAAGDRAACLMADGNGITASAWDEAAGKWAGPVAVAAGPIWYRYHRPLAAGGRVLLAYWHWGVNSDRRGGREFVTTCPLAGAKWSEPLATGADVAGFALDGRRIWRLDVAAERTVVGVKLFPWAEAGWGEPTAVRLEHPDLLRPGEPQVFYEDFAVLPRIAGGAAVLVFRTHETLYCQRVALPGSE